MMNDENLLQAFNAICDSLPNDDERRTFVAYFLGVLSNRIPREDWQYALEQAREYLAQDRQ